MRTTPLLFRLALVLALAPLSLLAQEPVPAGPTAATETPAEAVRDPALYQAEVELLSQGAGERRAAAARALGQVLVKITGQPQAAGNPVVRRALASAESLVVDSRGSESASDQQGNAAIGGVPVYKTLMTFAFDPASVDALVAGAGLPYWGAGRPRPLLWLAIDDGRGARLVNSQQLAVVKPLATRGLERGLRFGLPAGSAVEQAAVQTIWAQTPAPLLPLASRYGEQTQLLGRVYRSGGGWTADWVLSSGETELSRWSYSDPSPQRAIASGADGAADALARRDARALDVGEPGTLMVAIGGLRGAGGYTRAMGYLQTLAVVRSITVVEAGPDQLDLQLELAVGA
ncbi:MAG: DUF2066 domain-containing protein [Arenimonas sp.]|uniref:DUF2066 domain-containing protein n=1 Tax=Arenimonas sp. TaxID=1872635 RepID=UPI0025C14B3E|nr:DUF2066 domain-containing protein [Arenimonas sp.]MBW8367420.1 DUF2066 domain-containing protein [Arenimonas sp.]